MRYRMHFSRKCVILLAMILSAATTPTWSANAAPPALRPAEWAQPVASADLPGLPNLHRVAKNIYRSAQPTAEGMRSAEKLGIKTVVSLRAYHGDSRMVEGTKLTYKRIPIETWDIDEAKMREALALIAGDEGAPFLIHCQHGADRTGLLIALYRIAIEGWTKKAALDELQNGGYGYHTIWTNIPEFINAMDEDAWRRDFKRPNPESQ